jgi:two-component system, NarL family, response regulator LiaR
LPETEFIALTTVLEDEQVVGAVLAGANGYLLKNTESDELCRAIKAAPAGQVQLAPEATRRLVREIRTPEQPPVALSERETDASVGSGGWHERDLRAKSGGAALQ